MTSSERYHVTHIRPVVRDRNANAARLENNISICRDTPEVAFNTESVENIIKESGNKVLSIFNRSNHLLIITLPKIHDSKASFYKFSAEVTSCSKEICDLRVVAIRVDAPFKNGQIRLSARREMDDDLSVALVDSSNDVVRRATLWCSYAPKGLTIWRY